MKDLKLPDAAAMPVLGLGTWRMGESASTHAAEVAAVRDALSMGWRAIDTAEMYGDGGAERVVGEALRLAAANAGLSREDVFIVSKVLPEHGSVRGVREACARSLERLQLDHIDLYLLHWRGGHPLEETVGAFEALRRQGHIRHWGVSNFDTDDMEELWSVPDGQRCAANQVYYSLSERGVEFDLLPWLQAHRVPLMAYCPLDRGALGRHPSLAALAQRLGTTPARLALAWVLSRPGVMALPKAVKPAHLSENLDALGLQLDAATLASLDRLFPPPRRKRALAMT